MPCRGPLAIAYLAAGFRRSRTGLSCGRASPPRNHRGPSVFSPSSKLDGSHVHWRQQCLGVPLVVIVALYLLHVV